MRFCSRCSRASASSSVPLVARFDSLVDDLSRDALLRKLLPYTALAQLFVFLPQPRIGLGKGSIVKVAIFLEARDDGVDHGFSALARLDARPHQPPQLGLGAHGAAQRLHGVVIQASFVEEASFGLRRFGFEWQALTPVRPVNPVE